MTQKASANSSTELKPVHVFKAGSHTSAGGGAYSFSDADIKAIALAYNPAKHKAPIVIGHPTLDAPAWGWVDKLTAVGGDLFATESKVDPAFAEMRTAGRYEQRSIALYAPGDAGNPTPGAWYLRHVGYLGAMPPAVKGLEQCTFADKGAATVAFAESISISIEIIEGDSENETADATDATDITDPLIPEKTSSQQENPMTMTPEQIKQLQDKAARADAAEAEVTALKAAAVQTARAAFAEKRTAEATEFVATHIKRGVLQPAHKERVIALLAQEPAKVEFSEGGTTVNTDAAQILRDVLTGAVAPVEFGEHAGGKPPAAKAGNDAELHDKATALSKEKGITYEAALRQLC
jgi:hypothetical protein